MPRFIDIDGGTPIAAAADARAAIGSTAVGDAVFTAANAAAARTAMSAVSAQDVADQLPNGATTIGAAAFNTFLARSVSVDALLAQHAESGVPIIVPHRGAGDNIAPENVFQAWEIGASFGLGVLDGGDWRATSDGALVSFHDTTTGRTCTRDRAVSELTAMEASQLVVDCSTWFGGNFADTKIITADQMLGTFGNTNVMMIEPKDTTAAEILAPMIARMGIQASVVVTSFNPTDLGLFRDVGCTHLMLSQSTVATMPSPATRAEWQSYGFNWLSIPYNGAYTPANVTTLLSEGFNVILYTLSRKAQLSLGTHNWEPIKNDITAYFSGDPIYFRHALTDEYPYRRTTDPFITQTWYHGHIAGVDGQLNPEYRGEFRGVQRLGFPTSNADRWVLCGWGSPLASPTNFTLDYYLTFDTIGSDTNRWLGVQVGSPTDYGYSASSGANTWESGYSCYFRLTGQLNILKRSAGVSGATVNTTSQSIRQPLVTTSDLTAGAAITAIPVTATAAAIQAGLKFRLPNDQIATVATGGASLGATSIPIDSLTPTETVPSGSSLPQTVPMRIVVTPTAVTFSRMDSVSATVTATDGDHRGPYWYIGQSTQAAGQVSASFSEMVIT